MKVLSMDELTAMFSDVGGEKGLQTFGISKNIVNDIMMHEVADVVEEILLKHIQSDIYDAYSPHPFNWSGNPPAGWYRVNDKEIEYKRRNSLTFSSLGSYREMQGDILFVTADAEANQAVIGNWSPVGHGAFLQMLEAGPGPIWHGAFPRPAISNAQAEVDSSPEIQKAFMRGLRRWHIKV